MQNKNQKSLIEEIFWQMLPEELSKWFEIEKHEKTEQAFRLWLIEKNIVPELSEKYRGKRIINSILNSIVIDDFPIRGRKGELIIMRRSWKFDGVKEVLTRKIEIREGNTKLSKEFALFLKEVDRKCANAD